MPLLDHFHPPLSEQHPWESFHSAWAAEIMRLLNRVLPRRYRATVNTSLGRQVAADVAEFERPDEPAEAGTNGPGGGVATQTYAPPATTMVLPALFPDDLEVRIQDTFDSQRLVAVVELVSPRNKDRPDARRGFAGKCAAYLQRGLGLLVVDTVSDRLANLHDELIRLLELPDAFLMPPHTALYAVAYRPAVRGEEEQIDVWALPLAVGELLPELPLALRGARAVPIDLELTYRETCAASRVP